MKKNILIGILVVILVSIGFRQLKDVADSKSTLKSIDDSEAVIIEELKILENNKVNDNLMHLEEVTGLVQQVYKYENIVKQWIDKNRNQDLNLARDVYQVESMIITDDVEFPIPYNGDIVVDSKNVEIRIKVVFPPKLSNEVINDFVNQYDNVFELVQYDTPDNLEINEETFVISYENLLIGDEINLDLGEVLKELLILDDSKINIIIGNEFLSGEDYFPRDISKKIFSGGYENEGYEEVYEQVDKDIYKMVSFNTGDVKAIKIMLNQDIVEVVTYKSDDVLNDIESIILPKVIRLGEQWMNQTDSHMITGINVPIETEFGILNTIEVTTDHDGGFLYSTISNYAIGFGKVYYNSSNVYIDKLLKVEYIE